ncbi:MAG: XDD4 family exosortase-dependent surface protein [Phycisphaerales bacterium]
MRSHIASRGAFAFLSATTVALLAGSASAAVTFTGTGNNPEVNGLASGSATFSVSGNTLTVTLTNTTSPRTTAQGNALVGVAFDVNGSAPGLDLTSVTLGAGAAVFTNGSTSNTSTNLNGSYTDVLGASPLAAYGASSSGFAGRFNGGSISLGNSGPNYGVVADGTFENGGGAGPFGGSQFPFIQSSIVLTFTGAAGISEDLINNVSILFGTDGTGVVITRVPAPSAAALLGLGALAAGRRRRR